MAAIAWIIRHLNLAAVDHLAIAIAVAWFTAPNRADVATAALGVRQVRAAVLARAAVVRIDAHVGFAPVDRVAVAVVVRLIAHGDVASAVLIAARRRVCSVTRPARARGTAEFGLLE